MDENDIETIELPGAQPDARKPIGFNDSLLQVLETMGEGNIGAITVLMQLIKEDPMLGLLRVLDLDDMNIRGEQIWVGYKDHCGEKIADFAKCIQDRDRAMIETINHNRGYPPKQVAVEHGGSYRK